MTVIQQRCADGCGTELAVDALCLERVYCTPCDMKRKRQSEDERVVKSVWKSAHAVEDWPGKVTIRRFSPFKKLCVEGEGATVAEAWKNVADRIRKIWMDAEGINEQDIAETMPPRTPDFR